MLVPKNQKLTQEITDHEERYSELALEHAAKGVYTMVLNSHTQVSWQASQGRHAKVASTSLTGLYNHH